MPSVERKDLASNHFQLSIKVSKAELQSVVEAELKKFQKKAQIKGFRQGQVPMSYVKSMFGKNIVGEKLGNTFSDELYKYIDETKIRLLGQPMPVESDGKFSFNIDRLDPEYVVTYEMGHVPPFEIKGLDNTVSIEKYAVTDIQDLVESDFEHIRKQAGGQVSADDTIQENDMLTIAAKEVAGDYSTDIKVLTRDIQDEDLRKQVLTLKKGDSLQFDVRKLESFKDEKMFRKYILGLADDDTREVSDLFDGTISEVGRIALAEITEEFLTSNFGADATTEELAKAELAKGIEKYFDNRASAMTYRELQQQILKNNSIELPTDFLKRWLKTQNTKLEDSKLEAEFDAFADSLRWSLISEDIKTEQGIEASEAEIRQGIARQVAQYFRGQVGWEIIGNVVDSVMKDKRQTDEMRKEIEFSKLFEYLETKFNFVKVPILKEDFERVFAEYNARHSAENLSAEESLLGEDVYAEAEEA